MMMTKSKMYSVTQTLLQLTLKSLKKIWLSNKLFQNIAQMKMFMMSNKTRFIQMLLIKELVQIIIKIIIIYQIVMLIQFKIL